MPAPNLIQSVGGQAQKPTHFVSLFTSRFLVGIYTNRSLLRGPLQSLYSDFYHVGTTDALCDGLNTELSIKQTMIRRPGNPAFSSAATAAAINSFYSFHRADGTITLIADSTTDVEVVTPSTNTSIFTKTSGAGVGYFQGVNKALYASDGVDLFKYIPGTTNPNPAPGANASIWNFGGAAPTVAPTISIVQTGSAGTAWIANTIFSTMGLLYDSGTDSMQQLYTVNADGTNSSAATVGTSSGGGPTWNQTYLGTTTDGTVTFTNYGQILRWQPNHQYKGGDPIFDPGTNCVFIASHNYTVTSGSVYPNFNSTLGISGARVTEKSGARWENIGQVNGGPAGLPTCIKLRIPSQVFNKYDPPINGTGGGDPTNINCATVEPHSVLPSTTASPVYLQAATTPGTTGTGGTPTFSQTVGAVTHDAQLGWQSLGKGTWVAGTPYTAWTPQGLFSALKDANGNFQVCIGTGSSAIIVPGTTATLTAAGAASGGQTTYTGTFATPFPVNFPVVIAGFVNGGNNGKFQVVSCNGTTLVTTNPNGVAETHAGTAQFNPWGTTYGAQILDGTVTWVCVGAASPTWAASTQWYLPSIGFVPPLPSQQFGSPSVIDTNNNNQFVVSSGKTGTTAPAWQGLGLNTTDNGVTWYTASSFTAAGFSWTTGYGWCFAFKARSATSTSVLTAPPLQLPNTNSPNILGPLGPPIGCGDGSVSTASPVVQTIGANVGAQVRLAGLGSTDPQYDTVVIFRSADGFGASGPYLYLTEIAMPPVLSNGKPGTWSVVDFMPDTATALLPGLNPTITAPTGNVNDPPPGQLGSTTFQASASNPLVPAAGTTILGLVEHQGRLWGFNGTNVWCSGGPDTNPGNGFTSWPPGQVFPFGSNVVKLIATSSAILVFTVTDVYLIGGGPAISTYYSQLLCPTVGLLSPNAVTMVLGVPYLFTSDLQLIAIDPSGGFSRIGHPIGDKLSLYNPTSVYVTYHSFGDQEHAVFISNGSSEWYRCDPYPTPDAQLTGPVWSPRATIAGGFKALQSVETSPGTRTLLVGPASAGTILGRDSTFTTFTDNGSAYSSFFTMGNIVLAHSGQMAELGFVEMDFTQIGSQPTVSVILDELSATNGVQFEIISNSFVSDPPKKFGPTATPKTMWMNRYYFDQTTPGNGGDQTPASAWCKHLQIKVDYGNTDTVQNELLAFTIFGALWQEK